MNKQLELIKNIFYSGFKRLPGPYKITLALTYRCNLKCKICNVWKTPIQKEMGPEEVEILFRNLDGLSWLDLSGGEITLRDDIIEIIRIILENSKKIAVFHISTNGQQPGKALLLTREVLKHNLTPVINISLDGPAEINDYIRGAEGAYKNSLESFRKVRKAARGRCYLSCTISDYNLEHIETMLSDIKKEIPDFNPGELHFNVFHNSSHYYNNSGMDCLSQAGFENVKKYFLLSSRGGPLKVFLEKAYLKGLTRYFQGNRFPVGCQALNSSCFINPQGKVYPCGMYDKPLGELKENGFKLNRLWNSSYALEIRNTILQKKCPGCWTPCEAYPAVLGGIFKKET
jgi:MoaA/NifB/PqqE/SkfB family radical SAM enzyme